MSNIIKIENGIVQSSNNFVMALQSKKVMDCLPEEISKSLSVTVLTAYFDFGLKNPLQHDFDAMLSRLTSECFASFKTLTLTELNEAIKQGVRGTYDSLDAKESFGISVVKITKWFAAYMSSPNRKSAKEELQKLLEPKPYEPTEEEKQVLRLEVLYKAWQEFQNNGTFDDRGNAVFSTLTNLGKLKFTHDQKVQFGKDAKAKIKAAHNPAMALNPRQRNDYQTILNGLESGNETERIAVEAKKIALNFFFNDLKEMETDLEELLGN